jgi:hypothetical protein
LTTRWKHRCGKCDHEDWAGLLPSRQAHPDRQGFPWAPHLRPILLRQVEYKGLDVVLYNGSSYVALCDDPGTCPSQKWQLVAAAGRDGATGPRGERGERGLIGPRGEPAQSIIGCRVDRAKYTAVPVLSNGIKAHRWNRVGCSNSF